MKTFLNCPSRGQALRIPALLLALCLLPAAGARAQLITKVAVTAEPLTGLTVNPASAKVAEDLRRASGPLKTGVCRGEVFAVAVETKKPGGPGKWTSVAIDGYPGSQRFLQFQGKAGTRLVHVVASTEEGQVDSRSISVPVNDCEVTPALEVRSRFNPYHPYTVDFTIENRAKAGPRFSGYQWSFGDGFTAQTSEPYVSHSYVDKVDGKAPYQTFVVTVAERSLLPGRPARPGAERRYAVTLQNNYYHARKQGIVQPLAFTNGTMERRGDRLVGSFRLRNLEAEPVIFERATVENQYCDPQRTVAAAPTTPAEVIFRGGLPVDRVAGRAGADPRVAVVLEVRRSLPSLPADTVVIPPKAPAVGATPIRPIGPTGPARPARPGRAGRAGSPVPAPAPAPAPASGRNPFAGTVVPLNPGGGPTVPGGLSIPPVSGVVVLPAGQSHEGFLTLDAVQVPQEVCGFGYHLSGRTASGLKAYASLYFEVRKNPFLKTGLADQRMRQFLVELGRRGLVKDKTRITQEDLYQLEQQGKVRRTSQGWEIL